MKGLSRLHEELVKARDLCVNITIPCKDVQTLRDVVGKYIDMQDNCAGCTFYDDSDMNKYENYDGLIHCGWIPVSERLPEDRRSVLVTAFWHETYQVMMACYYGEGLWWCVPYNNCGEHMQNLNPIAWMPLPEPYKESDYYEQSEETKKNYM